MKKIKNKEVTKHIREAQKLLKQMEKRFGKVKRTGSEFGKGTVYNLMLFAHHFGNDQARELSHIHLVMSKHPKERALILSELPDAKHNYGWNKDVKFWYDKIVPIYGSVENAFSERLKLWANGASDHLYELEIPAKYEKKELGMLLRKIKKLGLEMGHSFSVKKTYRYKDFVNLWDWSTKACQLIDKQIIKVPSVKATWE
jgi:hypothetical protein